LSTYLKKVIINDRMLDHLVRATSTLVCRSHKAKEWGPSSNENSVARPKIFKTLFWD